MKKHIIFSLLTLLTSLFFIACGGGGGTPAETNNNSGNIDNVVIDPQAYYVDAQDGNDDNDGKTPQTAWKSLSKINSITINAGNKILFRIGQKWQGQLEIKNSGTAENPIVIGSYGEGLKPVISAVGKVQIHENNNNNNVEDNEWIPYTAVGGNGLSVQFKESVPDPANTWLAVILNSHPDRVKINGQEVLGAFDSSELGAQAKWSYNRDKDGTVFYYYGNDKPTEIETNLFTSPLYIHDNQHIIIQDIALEGGYVAAVFIENASNITVKNLQAGNMSKQGVYVKAENNTVKNILIDNCTIDSKYTLDYSFTGTHEANGRTTTTRGASEGIMFWGGVQDSVVSNNILKNWTHANINFSTGNQEALINNEVYSNTLSAPDIAYGGRIGVDGENTYNNNFHNNTITDIKAPIQFNGHDNTFAENVVQNVEVSPIKPNDTGYGIILQGYTSRVYNNKIINNTFKNIAKEAIKVLDNVGENTLEPNTIE